MTDLSYTAPTAAELRAIEQRAHELRAEAFGIAIKALFKALTAPARALAHSPSCARPLHSH